MANTKSGIKSLRASENKRLVNKARKSKMRTSIKKVEKNILDKDISAAKESIKVMESEIMKGAKQNIIKKNTASRKLSRMYKAIRAISEQTQDSEVETKSKVIKAKKN
ncbi:30S ribosomal protein S20 [Flavobacteriaceae bacterium]|nr:30S ribosomal protein S20 [Flavobacteriaceae bacterium]